MTSISSGSLSVCPGKPTFLPQQDQAIIDTIRHIKAP